MAVNVKGQWGYINARANLLVWDWLEPKCWWNRITRCLMLNPAVVFIFLVREEYSWVCWTHNVIVFLEQYNRDDHHEWIQNTEQMLTLHRRGHLSLISLSVFPGLPFCTGCTVYVYGVFRFFSRTKQKSLRLTLILVNTENGGLGQRRVRSEEPASCVSWPFQTLLSSSNHPLTSFWTIYSNILS